MLDRKSRQVLSVVLAYIAFSMWRDGGWRVAHWTGTEFNGGRVTIPQEPIRYAALILAWASFTIWPRR